MTTERALPNPLWGYLVTIWGLLPLSLCATIACAQSVNFSEYPPGTAGPLRDPYYIAAGPDGAMWFTETSANKIGRITTEGVITEFNIPTAELYPSGPYGITAGSDGAIWFTENGANNIGRITTAGEFAEYPIPTPLSGPIAITSGPDDALWFTENGGSNIGRITTAGIITEFACPTPNCGPYGITPGPDGALWFVEQAGKIGQITIDGVITEFPAPPNSYFITAGSDGALWFPQDGGTIGRMTTGGEVSSYALNLSARSASAVDVTAGPDGALWFTEIAGVPGVSNKIGRFSIGSGTLEFYFANTNTEAYGVAFGPDGALWFTIPNGQIGRAALVFPTPSIAAVRNGADGLVQTIQTNSWVTIYGTNLASYPGRGWGPQDFVNGRLPTSLNGVSVTVNDSPASIAYISPTQINLLAPPELASGQASVVVTSVNAESAPFSVLVGSYSPAFFNFSPPNQRYVAAVFASSDGAPNYVAPTSALGVNVPSRPAQSGDVMELFGTGFGPTSPAAPEGAVFFGAYGTATPVTITIAGVNATVSWAGLTEAGLDQLNVTLPPGVPNGDASVIATVGGVESAGSVFIPVRQ